MWEKQRHLNGLMLDALSTSSTEDTFTRLKQGFDRPAAGAATTPTFYGVLPTTAHRGQGARVVENLSRGRVTRTEFRANLWFESKMRYDDVKRRNGAGRLQRATVICGCIALFACTGYFLHENLGWSVSSW